MKLFKAILETLFGTDSHAVYRYGPRPGQLWHEVGRQWSRTVEVLSADGDAITVRTVSTSDERKFRKKSVVKRSRFHGKSGGYAFGPADFTPAKKDAVTVPYWILGVAILTVVVAFYLYTRRPAGFVVPTFPKV